MPEQPSEMNGSQTTSDMTVTYSQRIAGISRVENPKISYGNPVSVDESNINKIGFSNDIHTYHMDNEGHLNTIVEGHPFSYDFPEKDPMDFLKKFGMDNRNNAEQASNSFMIQTVKINGYAQGYFVFNKLAEYGDTGLYLDASAINTDKMDKSFKNSLFATEQNSPVHSTSTTLANPKP